MLTYDIHGKPITPPAVSPALHNYDKWKGAVMVVQGNSLTQHWPEYLANNMGMDVSAVTRLAGSLSGNRTAPEIIQFVEDNYPANVDLVILQGDGNVQVSTGFSDQLDGENSTHTWAAQLNYLIRTIRARYPNVCIALMADSVWYDDCVDQYWTNQNRGNYESMKGIAEYNRCAFFDVDHGTPFNPTHGLDNYYTQFNVSIGAIDGVHPNAHYYKVKAWAVAHFVAGLMHEPEAPNSEVEGWQNNITYTITNTLTNVTNSKAAVNWAANTPYEATLTAASGVLSGVTVTMGGVDVTADVYASGKINIERVTGNIVITASAL